MQGAAGATNLYWAKGIQAALPANGAAKNQVVFVNSVSCPSAGNCSAVGSYNARVSGGGLGLLLSQTAGKWTAGVEAALPENASKTDPGANLVSVSCASAGNCSAVGAYNDNSGNTQGLLLTETGGSWKSGVEVSLPASAEALHQLAGLQSVSCVSDGNCTAVGTYRDNNADTQGLLLTETAGVWTTGVEADLPANAAATVPAVSLSSVSCASAGDCTAIGTYREYSGNNGEGLLLTESAGSWAKGLEAALPPNAAATDEVVFARSVSCASAGNCTAVGSYTDGSGKRLALLLAEAAGSWAPGVEAALPTPPRPGINPSVSADSVACASDGNCTAVGTYRDNNADTQGLLLTETAGVWTTGVEAPLPANAVTNAPAVALNSVSCASAGNCAAVGAYDTAESRQAEGLLLTETAGRWTTGVEALLPANARTNPSWPLSMTSVSCPSARHCSAVGTYGDNSGRQHGLLIVGSGRAGTLTVSKRGAGSGTVTSSPSGIACGSTCAHQFAQEKTVTLAATPRASSAFVGWSGACRGHRGCRVTIVSGSTVTATFAPKACVVPKLKRKPLQAADRSIRCHRR